jgi:hypothetical protein
MERVNPYRDHRLEVTVRNDQLIIRKKPGWIVDRELVELYEHRAKDPVTQDLIPATPEAFHVRYFWKDRISFTVTNPETDATWPGGPVDRPANPPGGIGGQVRRAALQAMRWLFSQRRRNARLDVVALLRCPQCRTGVLRRDSGELTCVACNSQYAERNGVCRMTSPITQERTR